MSEFSKESTEMIGKRVRINCTEYHSKYMENMVGEVETVVWGGFDKDVEMLKVGVFDTPEKDHPYHHGFYDEDYRQMYYDGIYVTLDELTVLEE